MLGEWRTWIIAGATFLALWLGIRRSGRPLGIQRQVPRQWGGTLGETQAYVAWGMLLGVGFATTIPYSVYVLLIGVQLASGAALGAIVGAAFGFSREGMALISARRLRAPSEITGLLPTFRQAAARLNALVIAAAGVSLTALRWL
jgi:hypothetical protein